MSNDLQQEERLKNELPKGFDDWLKYFKEVANSGLEIPNGGLSNEQAEEHDRDKQDQLDQLTPQQREWEKIEKELNKVKGPMSKAFEFDTEVTEKNMLGRTKTKVVSSKKGEHSDEKSFDTRTMAQFAKVEQKQQKEMMKYTELMANWEKRYLAAGATPNEVNEYWKKMEAIVGENFLPNRGVDYVRLFYAVNPAMQEIIQEAKLEEEQNDTTHDDIKGKVSKVKKYANKLIDLIPDEDTKNKLKDVLDKGSTLINLTVDTHKALKEQDSKEGVSVGGNALSFIVSNTAGEDVGAMFENMTDLFSTSFNTVKDGSELQSTDENAPLDNSIKTLIEQYEKKKQLIESANALFEKGIEVASEFFAPLALLSTGKEFIENILDACKWGDAFNKASDMMLIAESTDDVYQHPIAQRLLRQKIEISKATVDGVANLAKMVGQTLELTPVGGVGLAVEKGAALLKKGAKFIFSRIDKSECKIAWKRYKEAQNSDDRLAKLDVFKHHAHMAFLAFAYGATVEKNPVAIQMCIDAGLTIENLEDKDTDLKIVAKFFALEGGDLDMTLQPEEKPGVVEKIGKKLADKIKGRKDSIPETNWQATDLSLTLTAFEKNCTAAELAGWYAAGTSKIENAFKKYEKAQQQDDGQDVKKKEQHFRSAYFLKDMLRQYSPTNQVGGEEHKGMNKYLIDLGTKIDKEQMRLYKAWNESLKEVNTGWNADHIEIELSDKYWDKIKKEAREKVGWEGKSVGLSSPLKKVAKADEKLSKATAKKKTKDVEKYAKRKTKALFELMKKLQGWKESQPGMAGVRKGLIDKIQAEISDETIKDEDLELELQKLQEEEGGDQSVEMDSLELEVEALSEDDQLMLELAELAGGEEPRDELEDICNDLKQKVRRRGEDAKFFLEQLQKGAFKGDKKIVKGRYKEILSDLNKLKKQYEKARKKYNKQRKEIEKANQEFMKEAKKTNKMNEKAEMLIMYSAAYNKIVERELQKMDEDFQLQTEEALKLSDRINESMTRGFQVDMDDEELEEEYQKLLEEMNLEGEEEEEEEIPDLPNVPTQPVGGGQGEKPNQPQKQKVTN